MINEVQKQNIIKQIIIMKKSGLKVIVVHGGGPEIDEELKLKNIQSEYKNGLRVTTKDTLEIVKMVLIGKINTEIVNMINQECCNAIGLSGIDGNIIKCTPSERNIGYVGNIEKINNKLILDLLEKDYIPVISPIGTDENGEFYNINADTVASEIAISLKCKKIIILTNTDGLMDKNKNVISMIDTKKVNELIDDGTISGGMIPKVQACIKCLNSGIENAHIISGLKKNINLYELFNNKLSGTMIYNEN